MKILMFLMFFLASSLISQELKVKANQFSADEKSGISIFKGKVDVVKGKDNIKAQKVVIYTDEKHQPIKFIATGDVSFEIKTKKGSAYKGKAQKVIYIPKSKEYNFFGNVHLQQLDEKKEIIGEEVVLKTIEGKAYAKGAKQEPVIMIFKMKEEE